MQSSFHLIDWVIVAAYLAAMAGVGVYFSRRQTSLEHFMLADRNMGWLPVGLSLMAALNSGIDYLMQPSPPSGTASCWWSGITSWLALYPWVSKVTFPFYRRLNVFTAYEYLEARFDVRVRSSARDLHPVAARLDGHGDVRAKPGHQCGDGRAGSTSTR